jgi:hypothetical protein
MTLHNREKLVDVCHLFNGPNDTRLAWVVVEVGGETRGQQVRLTPEEATMLAIDLAPTDPWFARQIADGATCAAIDNAVQLGGDL